MTSPSHPDTGTTNLINTLGFRGGKDTDYLGIALLVLSFFLDKKIFLFKENRDLNFTI